MSPFRPRKSSEEPGFSMQAVMQHANGVGAGYPIPKLCSHKAVINYSRGEFNCLAKQLHDQSPSIWHFLSWSAYSSGAATDLARRQCPLKRCNHTVIDDADMLRAHVFSCAFLSDGCYWCYHCNREERFTPFQCRDCPASPFRKDRLSQKAKKIFRWLSTRSHQKDVSVSRGPTVDKATSSSAHRCSGPTSIDPDSKSQIEMYVDLALPELEGSLTAAELSGYDEHLAELDSVSQDHSTKRSDMPGLEYHPQHPQKSFTNNSSGRSSFSTGTSNTNFIQAHLSERQDPQGYARSNTLFQARSNSSVPRLQTPVSPISPEQIHGNRINTMSSSPTDTVCSEDSLFSKSSSETSVSSVSTLNSSYMHMPPSISIGGRLTKAANAAGLNSATEGVFCEDQVRESRSIEELESCCQHPDVLAEFVCAKDCATLSGSNTSKWFSPEHIVQDFWVVIENHVEVSMETLRQFPSDVRVRDLLRMTPEVIAARGLGTWGRMLNGYFPSNTADLFSFIHVTYACAMVLHDCQATNRLQELFSHVLLIEEACALSADDKALCLKIVEILWQPPVEPTLKNGCNIAKSGQDMMHSGGLLSDELVDYNLYGTHTTWKRASSTVQTLLNGGNKVFDVLSDFLTVLDGAVLLSRLSAADAPPLSNIKDENFVRRVTQSVTGPLTPRSTDSEPSLVAFASEIRTMETFVEMGWVSSIREVEVGLIWAARRTIRSLSLCEKVSGLVKESCLCFAADYASKIERSVVGIKQLRQFLNDVQSKPISHSNKMQQRWANMPSKTSSQHPDATNTSTPDGKRNLVSHKATHRNAVEAELYNNATTKRRKVSNVDHSSSPPTSPVLNFPQAADSEQANFSCSICGLQPRGDPRWYRGNLAKHMKIHGNNKKIPCEYPNCGKAYSRSDNLRHHIKEHHSETRHPRDPTYGPQHAEPLGNHLGSSHDEDAPALGFDYAVQNSFTGPGLVYAPLQTYHMSPGDGRCFN